MAIAACTQHQDLIEIPLHVFGSQVLPVCYDVKLRAPAFGISCISLTSLSSSVMSKMKDSKLSRTALHLTSLAAHR